MGTFDTVKAWVECPYCRKEGKRIGLTKDLKRLGHTYSPIDQLEKIIDRSEIPVSLAFPEDKAASVWESQRERSEAQATLPEQFHDLDTVTVLFECTSTQCQFDSDREGILRQGTPTGAGRYFHAEIQVNEEGKLEGQPFNIEKKEIRDDLDKYKEKYPDTYQNLRETYGGHEPVIVRNWPHQPVEEVNQ